MPQLVAFAAVVACAVEPLVALRMLQVLLLAYAIGLGS